MRIAITTAALLLLATPALAQAAQDAPIAAQTSTAAPATTPPAPTGDATATQISDWIQAKGGDSTQTEPVAGLVSGMPQRDRAIHGEAGVSVGSGGYRSAYAVANMPIGERSDLTVAVADEHLGGSNRTWGGGRGGDRRSLGVALNLNGGPGRAVDDCDRTAPPKWSLGLPDDASLTNRCRQLLQHGSATPTP